MKFIIDGDGTVSRRAAYDLLTDLAAPYQHVTIVTSQILGVLSEAVTDTIQVLATFSNFSYEPVLATMTALETHGDKIYIVLDAYTRVDNVAYCWEHDISVLDLEKGLYPFRK